MRHYEYLPMVQTSYKLQYKSYNSKKVQFNKGKVYIMYV